METGLEVLRNFTESDGYVIIAPSSSRCTVMPLSHRCHWAPLSHRLRIAGPAAIAIRHCCALYLSRHTPLPSRIRLRCRGIVRCRHCHARCTCFAQLASILWHGASADAVDLFEEIWSYVQKISLKNLWIPENKYQRDLWTSMDKYALNGQWGGQLGAPYAATAHSFLFRVGADPDFRHRCRHHRHRD